jgi:hypothetical protein
MHLLNRWWTQSVEKAKRAGIPRGKKPRLFELKPLRLVRVNVVKCSPAKSERGTL